MNRFDRITAILIQLQSKRVVKAQEIADRFGISLRTVYRDVRSLEEAGVPVIGEAGTGYMLAEGYRLPPVQLTRTEAAAFVAAEKLVHHFADQGLADTYRSALLKVRAVLKMSEKDFLAQLDNSLAISARPDLPGTDLLSPVLQAIGGREVLQLMYQSEADQQPTRRNIEPMAVFFRNDNWYLLAWCLLRESIRHFRVDRIQQMRPTGQIFEPRAIDIAQDVTLLAEAPTERQHVVIQAEKSVLRYTGQQKWQHGFVRQEEVGNSVILHFDTPSLDYLARWMMQFADKVEQIDSPELSAIFCQILEKAKKFRP